MGTLGDRPGDPARDLAGETPRRRGRAKLEAQDRARELRVKGWSYNAIAAELGVAKSSVSVWCAKVLLTEEQRATLLLPVAAAQAKRAASARAGRIRRTELIHEQAIAEIGALSERELFLVGVALYWAEGAKQKPWNTSAQAELTNSDPSVIRVFLAWLALIGVERDRLSYRVDIHERADVEAARRSWGDVCATDPSEIRVLLKRHKPTTNRRNVGDDYIGGLVVRIRRSTDLNRRIEGWWKGIVANNDSLA